MQAYRLKTIIGEDHRIEVPAEIPPVEAEVIILVPDEAIEAFEDRVDVEAAERILDDPHEVPMPYEEARKDLGLA